MQNCSSAKRSPSVWRSSIRRSSLMDPVVPAAGIRHTGSTMWFVRYGIGAVMFVAGLLMIALGPKSSALEGGCAMIGAALSVWLLNVLHRYGVQGNTDRDREEAARRHFDETGRWPDDAR